MFKLAARLALALIFIGAALTTVIPPLLARSPEVPPYWIVDDPDCPVPCIFGLNIGETDIDGVIDKFITAGIFDGINGAGNMIRFAGQPGTDHYTGGVFIENGRASQVMLEPWIPLERLLFELGVPDCLYVDDGQYVAFWFWPHEQVALSAYAGITSRTSTWHDLVTSVVYVYEDRSRQCPQGLAWQGFLPAWYYEALQFAQSQPQWD